MGRILTVGGGLVGLLNPFSVLLAWLSAADKSRVSKSFEVPRVWEVYDDRHQFMAVLDASRLDDAFRREDVSAAWMVWSGAAETAHVDAFCFAGSPVPHRGLVLVRGVARFRVVRLGGPKVRKACNNVADPLDDGDVFWIVTHPLLPYWIRGVGSRLCWMSWMLGRVFRCPGLWNLRCSGNVFLGVVLFAL